ncbi:hypothetical protein BG52_03965 [Paenibacillus darwinianus]|nr:hypothetical protein BG52_03965 [Paenibacillus darwinianus]
MKEHAEVLELLHRLGMEVVCPANLAEILRSMFEEFDFLDKTQLITLDEKIRSRHNVQTA